MTGSDDHPQTLRTVAECVVEEAAAYVRRRRVEVFGSNAAEGGAERAAVATKSTPTDPVTVVDTETEELVRLRLSVVRPGESVLGEEGGGPSEADRVADAVTWVLDPIDGTVNFLYGIPAYAVSAAAQVGGESVAGAVADVTTGEIYSAALGYGAHVRRGGEVRRLRCTGLTDLSMALLGTGFAYSPARRAAQGDLLAGLLPVVRDVRRMGSAALDLCMVAAGRLDAHYEHGLHVWDWAAGALIAAEAGAWVILPPADGSPGAGLCLAAGPGVADALYTAMERLGGLAPLPD
jgi:myo-inositol-1(or 4)-monophosphatase